MCYVTLDMWIIYSRGAESIVTKSILLRGKSILNSTSRHKYDPSTKSHYLFNLGGF